jgi:hypothetical protein
MKVVLFVDLPSVTIDNVKTTVYYREDILDWYNSNPNFHPIFPTIPKESVAIFVTEDTNLPQEIDTYNLTLPKQQYIEFAFCNYSYHNRELSFNKELNVVFNSSGKELTPDIGNFGL